MLLTEVCEKLLNNADMSLGLDDVSGEITLEFYPAAFDGVIYFYCKDFTRLNFRKSADDTDAIFVGETKVTIKEEKSSVRKLLKEDGWASYNEEFINSVAHIEIEGGSMLSIVCEKFSWKKGNEEIQFVL
jgi:hypothetical protein